MEFPRVGLLGVEALEGSGAGLKLRRTLELGGFAR